MIIPLIYKDMNQHNVYISQVLLISSKHHPEKNTDGLMQVLTQECQPLMYSEQASFESRETSQWLKRATSSSTTNLLRQL